MTLKSTIDKISAVSKHFQSKMYKLAEYYADPWVVQMVKDTVENLKAQPSFKYILEPTNIEIQQSVDRVHCVFVLNFEYDEAQTVYAGEGVRKTLLTNTIKPKLEGRFGVPATITYTENPYKEY